jgi:hypothetical protein
VRSAQRTNASTCRAAIALPRSIVKSVDIQPEAEEDNRHRHHHYSHGTRHTQPPAAADHPRRTNMSTRRGKSAFEVTAIRSFAGDPRNARAQVSFSPQESARSCRARHL